MADILVDAFEDYHGDPLSPLIAGGSVITTFTGTLGASERDPVLSIYSRTGVAAFVLTHQQAHFGREVVELAAGDEYYVEVTSVDDDASISLAIADL